MQDIHTGQIAALARQLANGQLLGARERPGKGAGRAGNKGCRVAAGAMLISILSIRLELAAASGHPG